MDGITDSMDISLSRLWKMVKDREGQVKDWSAAVHWIARRSNQSILKEIDPEYSLEVLMLKLNLQYFDHLM